MLKVVLSGNTYEVKDSLKAPEIGFRYNPRHKNWEKQVSALESLNSLVDRLAGILGTVGVRLAAFYQSGDQANRLVLWKDFGTVRNNEHSGEDDVPFGQTRSAEREETIQPVREGEQQYRVTIPIWLARALGCSASMTGRVVEEGIHEVQTSNGTRRAMCYHFIGHNDIGGTDRCHRCHRPLTDPVSRIVGYGAECCRALGLSRRVDMNDESNAAEVEAALRSQQMDVWIPIRYCRRRAI